MSNQSTLLFQVGQLAESRSFIPGYRGAWFRCEIKEVAWNNGRIRYRVRYIDYDADGLEWLNLCEVPKINDDLKKAKRELMLRPQFPPIYRESELPDTNAISDVAIVVDGRWSVGDMVDWWEEGCYWAGTITKSLGDETVEIKLPDEPVGEGLTYVASYKDLRPSLNWSPNSGWTLPAPMESRRGHSHARLIQPLKPGVRLCRSESLTSSWTVVLAMPAQLSQSSVRGTTKPKATPRLVRSKSLPERGKNIPGADEEQKQGESTGFDTGGSATHKPSVKIEVATSAETKDCENVSAETTGVDEPIPLNSTFCDNIESAILDLEELVCRVKWLKQILKFGRPSTSDDKWVFQEYPTAPEPK
ncbi:hypothetical protein vseg_014582 [Gypsophila vaccaria]